MATVPRTAKFAERTARLRTSTIRDLLKVTQQPDVISFAGGLPAPEHFPIDVIAECVREIMQEHGSKSLQYSVTEGIPEVREWVAERLTRRFGTSFEAADVISPNGSQQGLDLLGKILLDPGDYVVMERPSYLGAIQAFDAYQPRYLTVDTDEHGMIPESLERTLERADSRPKMVYLIPNFQNPTGRTLARERREPIVRICEHYDVPLIEDDPYGELRFEGEHLPALISIPSDGTIVYLGTGSKIMAPGLRVAWIVTKDRDVHEKLVLAKQGADLHSGTLSQYLFHRFASRRLEFEEHVRRIVNSYRRRRDVMHAALGWHMPPGTEFNRPEGGMFLWARVKGVDTDELLKISADRKVVFVPGRSFYPNRDVNDGMRLNFSNASEENIKVGIERLGHAIRTYTVGGF
jgi:2-aminoadipate transaminase